MLLLLCERETEEKVSYADQRTLTWIPCPPFTLLVYLKMQAFNLITKRGVKRHGFSTQAFVNMVVQDGS